MSTQQELDLEARLADLERQLAELAAKVNPLWSGGLDLWATNGYLQIGSSNTSGAQRFDKFGHSIVGTTDGGEGLWFLESFGPAASGPQAKRPQGRISGSIQTSTNHAQMLRGVLGTRNGSDSSALIYTTLGGASNDAAIKMSLSNHDGASGSAESGYFYDGATDFLEFRIQADALNLVTTTTPATLSDGMLWYNTTTNKLYARINGATVELGGGMSLIVKEADETVTNSNTVQNDDELLFAVAANEVWQFEGVLLLSAHPTPDFRVTFTGPTGAVGSFAAAYSTGALDESVSSDALGNVLSFAAASQGTVLRFWGGIHNGANAGNLQLKWAQNTSDANNTKVLAGSYIKYQKES